MNHASVLLHKKLEMHATAGCPLDFDSLFFCFFPAPVGPLGKKLQKQETEIQWVFCSQKTTPFSIHDVYIGKPCTCLADR